MGAGAAQPYSLAWWRAQNFPPDVPVLGNILTTTSRAMLIGPTGLGKTTLGMAMTWAMAAGKPFLHWKGSGQPRRVLYIDSEMPPTLMAARAEDATRRLGEEPPGVLVLPKMLANFPPLNTRAGQGYMDALIDKLQAEFVVFDNVRYLLVGDISKPEPWEGVNAWVLGLTSRRIGQLWLHHTGWNTAHGYGDSSREWNFDTVMMMKRPEKFELGTMRFGLEFTKNRTATPETAHEYRPVEITLRDDRWGSNVPCKIPQSHTAILTALEGEEEGLGRTALEKKSGLKHSTFEKAMGVLHLKGRVMQSEDGRWRVTPL